MLSKKDIIFLLLIVFLSLICFSCSSDSTTKPQSDDKTNDLEKIHISIASGNQQTGQVSTTIPDSLVALITDEEDNPVSGQRVDFEIIQGTGTLSPESSISNEVGYAGTMLTLGDQEEEIKVEAKVSGTEEIIIFTATSIVKNPKPLPPDRP